MYVRLGPNRLMGRTHTRARANAMCIGKALGSWGRKYNNRRTCTGGMGGIHKTRRTERGNGHKTLHMYLYTYSSTMLHLRRYYIVTEAIAVAFLFPFRIPVCSISIIYKKHKTKNSRRQKRVKTQEQKISTAPVPPIETNAERPQG